ncbi:MAG: NAD-binding protein [Candidatus Nitrotoga sp.]
MIVGGGNIGRRLAQALVHDYQVKLIEHNKKACERLATELPIRWYSVAMEPMRICWHQNI